MELENFRREEMDNSDREKYEGLWTGISLISAQKMH